MRIRSSAAGLIVAGLLLGCVSSVYAAFTAYGVSRDRLIKLGPAFYSELTSPTTVTNLQDGEFLVAIDYHGADGKLYVVTDQNRLYTVNSVTGVGTRIGTAAFADAETHIVSAFEIIPGTTEARVITKSNLNLRLSLTTGEIAATETPLSYAAGDPHEANLPVIRGAAYGIDNTLYGLDENLENLVRIGGQAGNPSPAEGVLTTVGSLGTTWTFNDNENTIGDTYEALDGMDLGPDGQLYICKASTVESLFSGVSIYTVDPVTGMASHVHGQSTYVYPVRSVTIVGGYDPNSDIDDDGVLDSDDYCSDTPPGTQVDEHGCPIIIRNTHDITISCNESSQKCSKKGVCKRKMVFYSSKTDPIENKTVMVSFYASTDAQLSSDDTLLAVKKAKFKKLTPFAKLKYTAKLTDPDLNVIAVTDSANEVAETKEDNNTVVVPKP